jgi:hypothetical protein|tara:strand:- start:3803 stop:4039 length:237 start_codon:yes stop_codon:yes gene_type:complete
MSEKRKIGLKDKNGVDIAESDKVRIDICGAECFGKVVYDPPSFTVIMDDGDGYNNGDYYAGRFSESWDWSEFEVLSDE